MAQVVEHDEPDTTPEERSPRARLLVILGVLLLWAIVLWVALK